MGRVFISRAGKKRKGRENQERQFAGRNDGLGGRRKDGA